MSDIDDIIMGGMVFKGGGGPKKDDDDKVKTKAKKKKYITGAHGSGSARQKAKYRQQRANRKSQKKKYLALREKIRGCVMGLMTHPLSFILQQVKS